MIRIDLVWAAAGFLAVGVVVVFVCWIFYSLNGNPEVFADEVNIEQCPYCTYVFLSCPDGDVLRCPRCKSFLNRISDARRGEIS